MKRKTSLQLSSHTVDRAVTHTHTHTQPSGAFWDFPFKGVVCVPLNLILSQSLISYLISIATVSGVVGGIGASVPV